MGRVWRWDGVVESWERNAEMQTQRLKRSLFNMRELMLLDLLKWGGGKKRRSPSKP
jgi:hypothetical protein